MFKNKLFFLLLNLFLSCSLYGQSSQTVRGTVKDKDSKAPVPAATVIISSDSSDLKAAFTDEEGEFKISGVTLGRKSIQVRLMGYNDLYLSNIVVNAGKEVVLHLEIEEKAIAINEVVVTGKARGETTNEMTTVSAHSFAIEETERYAGSRSDPARMASNFAGVQGADDSRNDIVIRGNSPMGLLYRVEDVNIENPNHFAVAGTTGGGISILNNKTFGNSDFMTGAFPAEYGNAIAGVFDIKMRSGNNERNEFTGQFGFLGTELLAEGPLSKKTGASFLATYRYSTLKLFEFANIKIGTSAVPNYQDASFKLNFPLKNNSNLSFFGIGGKSKIDIVISKYTEPQEEIYGEKDRDQYFGTGLGILGTTYTKLIGSSTFARLTLSSSITESHSDHDLVFRDSLFRLDSIIDKLNYKFLTYKNSAAFSISHKFSGRSSLKAGFFTDHLTFNFIDSNYNENNYKWQLRLNSNESAILFQPFIQWKYKFTDELILNAGLHVQHFTLSNSTSIEPRIGFKWQLSDGASLNFGYGLHSQMQPAYIYFQETQTTITDKTQLNKNLDFTKSHHFIAGYSHSISAGLRLLMETYYQYLYNIPVDVFPSSFSLLNQGSTFTRFFPGKLVNNGTGENYGVEFTLEKYFSKSYFYLLTASAYDSKYRGSDNIKRNTDFNGRFALNSLFGKEFKVGDGKIITTGTKITWAGGRRYTPADVPASRASGELIEIDSLRNIKQFRNYFRLDLKIGYKVNRRSVTHEIALDLINVLNRKNILGLTYSPDPENPSANPLREEYQLGFLPLFYYKIDF